MGGVAVLACLAGCPGKQGTPPKTFSPGLKDGQVILRKTPFTTIRVAQGGGLRSLRFLPGNSLQSVYDTGNPRRLVLSYTRMAMLGLACVPRARNILVIGLGGGSMVKYLQQNLPEARIEAVELDPEVLRVAQEYFDVRPDPQLILICEDGRKYLESQAQAYDLIFLDAYGPSEIPPALATLEFLQQVRLHLNQEGAVVANLWGLPENRKYLSMLRTFQEAFGEIHILRARPSNNRIVLGLPRITPNSTPGWAGQPSRPRMTPAALAQAASKLSGVGALSQEVQAGYETASFQEAPLLRDATSADEP